MESIKVNDIIASTEVRIPTDRILVVKSINIYDYNDLYCWSMPKCWLGKINPSSKPIKEFPSYNINRYSAKKVGRIVYDDSYAYIEMDNHN